LSGVGVTVESDRGPGARRGAPPQMGVELRRLFGELAAGGDAALAQIYRVAADELYGLALWRSGSPADAADAVQEVFVRVVQRKAGLGRIRDPLAYLRRMAHRAAIDQYRKRARRRESPLEAVHFLEAEDGSPERRIDAERASRSLAELPASQREAIYLRHFGGCSFAEIGRATGVPTFTAASRYRLGMRRLRELTGVER
jgi:RNA polymerase sigma-70 factor (ECF subfamily)